GVVTQPDRPAHRGRRVTPPPVKIKALAAGLPVVQPARLRDPEWPRYLAEFRAAVAVVVAFGQILPKAVLQVPARGSINVHASLQPRYRGAAPIQWAISRGETLTGVTTFQMDEGMDTGPILMAAPTPIGADETAGELAARLATLGAELLVDTLARLDTLTPTPQRHEEATLAPRLKKTDGYLEFARRAPRSRRALHDAVTRRTPSRPSPTRPSPAREVAAHVLERVEADAAYPDVLLDHALGSHRLSQRDVALTTELVYGTLRWQRYLDWILAPHSRRRLESLDARVRVLLRMAAYQIAFLERVPSFAAVNDTVALAPRTPGVTA